MLCAGESSGDAHAAEALQAFRSGGAHDPEVFGMGGERLEAAGMELLVDARELAVIGFVDVLRNYPRFRRRLARLRDAIRARRPDLLVLVDYPDFNLRLAETARELDIPVLFYVSPQVWAWRSGRVRRIGERVSHMAVLFPFEVSIYERAGIPVTYVGNPLVDTAVTPHDRDGARRALALQPEGELVALLPGSRHGELTRNLPVIRDTVRTLATRRPATRFVLPLASGLRRGEAEALLQGPDDANLPVTIVDGQSLEALRAADAALVASGTATLETALIGTPFAIVYVLHPLNHAIMKRLIRIPDIGLVNIVAERRVVAEFVQREAQPAPMADEIERLLDDERYRREQLQALAEVRDRLGHGGASTRVAELMQTLLDDAGRLTTQRTTPRVLSRTN